MSDADNRALIENLQRSNRFWKRLALSLMAALGLTILILTTSAAVSSVRAEQARRQAEDAAAEARMQAEDALQREHEARKAVEEALKEAAKLQQKSRRP
jgi:hypothetical protein